MEQLKDHSFVCACHWCVSEPEEETFETALTKLPSGPIPVASRMVYDMLCSIRPIIRKEELTAIYAIIQIETRISFACFFFVCCFIGHYVL